MFIKELTEKSVGLPVHTIDLSSVPVRISVRGVIENKERKIALIHAKGIAMLPGGKAEGQPLEEALRREIGEEVGAHLINVQPLGITREYRLYSDTPDIIQTHFFSAVVEGELHKLLLDEEEIAEGHTVSWVEPTEALTTLQQSLLDTTDPREILILNRDIAVLTECIKTEDGSLFADDASKAKLQQLEEVAKKAQYDYIMLKGEFDSYVRRVEGDNKAAKVQQLVDLVKKLTPIINQLGQSVSHLPEDLKENTRAAGVQLTYENALKILADLGIVRIDTIGMEPDMELHDPLGVEPTDDEAMKGKIIKEYEPGYVYEKDGIKKVITAAKVIVGS